MSDAPVQVERIQPNLTRLTAAAGITHHDTIVTGATMWVAMNAYDRPEEPDHHVPVYVAHGERERVVVEDEGVNPRFFVGPDGAPWVTVTHLHSDEDLEVIRPVGGPAQEPFEPFDGEPLWLEDRLAVFAQKGECDRWLVYDLDEELPARIRRIPPPGYGTYVRNDEGIHGLAGGHHRLLAADGAVLRDRRLAFAQPDVRIVELRFNGPSSFVAIDTFDGAREDRRLQWIEVAPGGGMDVAVLARGPFLSLWPVVRPASGEIVVQYTSEEGNGWLVIDRGRVVRRVRRDDRGYVDDAGARLITLPAGDWILSTVVAVGAQLGVVVHADSRTPPDLWMATVPVR